MAAFDNIWNTLAQLRQASHAWEQNQYGAREQLLSLCRTVIAELESPPESLQRMWWAEVSEIPTALRKVLPATLLTSLKACKEC